MSQANCNIHKEHCNHGLERQRLSQGSSRLVGPLARREVSSNNLCPAQPKKTKKKNGETAHMGGGFKTWWRDPKAKSWIFFIVPVEEQIKREIK
jgi:hypothetical protein